MSNEKGDATPKDMVCPAHCSYQLRQAIKLFTIRLMVLFDLVKASLIKPTELSHGFLDVEHAQNNFSKLIFLPHSFNENSPELIDRGL